MAGIAMNRRETRVARATTQVFALRPMGYEGRLRLQCWLERILMRRAPAFIAALIFALSASTVSAQVAAAAADPAKCSLTWLGFESQLEEAMASGKIAKIEDVPIGVTKPQRATLENGSRFAWKAIRPGFTKGYMESYKSEVAAYKLDRMLEMHMVPPIVERNIDGKTGAAVFWIENIKGWSVAAPPRGPEPMWSLQLTRMKMFDLLIANIDRNQGNLIYDADWHLFLIDHSRAFIDKKDLKNLAPLGRVDRKLWEKMQALTMADLDAGLGSWVDNKGKKALLVRRDLMAKEIKSLIAKRGEASVFY
jgi:hypothetical protein